MIKPTPQQTKAAFDAVRRIADESAYGGFVSDDLCQQIATSVASAVLNTTSTLKETTK